MFILKAAAARKSRPTVDRLSSPSSVPKKSPKKSAVKKAATSEGELTILKKKNRRDFRKKSTLYEITGTTL